MLKVLAPETNKFQNFKCGEIFCLTPLTYNVACCLCGEKINFEQFPAHFQQLHLSLNNDADQGYTEQSRIVSPIKNEGEDEAVELSGHEELPEKPIMMEKPCVEATKLNKSFAQQKKAGTVTKQHSGTYKVPCTKCDRTYKSKRALYNHLRLNHKAGRASNDTTRIITSTPGKEKHKCDECGNSFHSERQMESHECEYYGEYLDKNPIAFDEVPLSEQHQQQEHQEQQQASNAVTSNVKPEHSLDNTEIEEKLDDTENAISDDGWQNDDDSNVEDSLTKHKDGVVQCPQCDRSYKSKRALWNHQRINHKGKHTNHRCDNCGKNFRTSAHHRMHKCKNDSSLAETPIDYDVIQLMSVKTEIEIVPTDIKEVNNDNTDDYKDIDWKKEDNNDDSSEESEKDDNDESTSKPFPCALCDRAYKSRRGLWNHRRIHHNPLRPREPRKRNHKCDECGDLFHSEQHLRGHMYKHTGIVCDICGKKFTQTGNLTLHKIRHTGIKAHKCAECDNTFFTEKELRSHMMRHTGIWPHICEICGRRCRDHGVLTAHMRRHTGERPAKCEVCGKCFYSGHDLNVHSVTHSTARPFACDVCGSTFRSKKSLRVHKKLHTKDMERKHECKVCGKTFAQSSGLSSHMRTHDAVTLSSGVIIAVGSETVIDDQMEVVAEVEEAQGVGNTWLLDSLSGKR